MLAAPRMAELGGHLVTELPPAGVEYGQAVVLQARRDLVVVDAERAQLAEHPPCVQLRNPAAMVTATPMADRMMPGVALIAGPFQLVT